MDFKVTYTLRAKRVERWIRAVKRDFLDVAEIKVVGLDCEFTDPRRRGNQRAAVLQLSVAQETLVFQIVHADEVPQLLIDFLADKNIRFCGAAIHNDVNMLRSYRIIGIPSAINLQQILRNPVPNKQTPSLYDLANHYIGMGLEQKKKVNKKNKPPKTAKELEEEALIFGWGDFPLSHKQLQYAALDARLGFELGRRHFRALGYNSKCDRLELNIYE
ncbi:hypothetical protein QYE76_007490 [Lolium multiflorum]|uniref:3'-5' exonuclease domain-containing protein n=1 Tax=Lolium multiflorum TaxID=4521 RepID=A0AAD8RXR0_LOLMU|nr:hypothetical protein QYE76_007490 [Lolium multiflorum]